MAEELNPSKDHAVRQPRARGVAISTLFQSGSQIAASLLGVLLVKVQTSFLGLEPYGVFSTALTLVYTFSLLTDLGVSTVAAREIARQPKSAAGILAHNLGLRGALCLIVVPLIFGATYVLYHERAGEIHAVSLVLGCYLFFEVVRLILGAWLTAHGRSDLNALVMLFLQVCLVTGTLLVWWLGGGLLSLAVSYVSANAAAALLVFSIVRGYTPVRVILRPAAWPNIIASAFAVGLLQILSIIYSRLDALLVSLLIGTTEAGKYNISYLLLSAFSSFPAFIMTALVPRIAVASDAQLWQILRQSLAYISILTCGLAAVGVVCAPQFVLIVSGPEFAGAALPFQILICANVLFSMSVVFSYGGVYTSKQRPLVGVAAGGLVVNISGILLLVPMLGLPGAALANVPSAAFILFSTAAIVSGVTRSFKSIIAATVRPLFGAVLAGVVTTIVTLSAPWPRQPFVSATLSAAILLAVYACALTVLRVWPSELRNAVRSRLRRDRGRHAF